MGRNVLMRHPGMATLLAIGALAASLPRPAEADELTPPPVPHDVRVPPGNRPFLLGHAVGTQDYVCLPSATGVAWTLFTPQATLLDDQDGQVTTHFFSPNPFESGTVRATWQHSLDTSVVWGQVIGTSSDARFVAPGAIPWLLVQRKGVAEGPSGGRTLTVTTYVQRLDTSGGAAPSTGCDSSSDVGRKAFVPYSADYYFFRSDRGGEQ